MKRSIARLIDADAAIDAAIDGADAADGRGSLEREESIEEYVGRVPAVDAVVVVRCRDCKYAHMTYDGEVKYCDRISMPDDEGDYGYALYLPGDWFCADGERRDEDG